MARRFFVEQRASEKYPWQLVDTAAGLEAGPISIHASKRAAETARYELKKRLRNDRRIARLRAKRREELNHARYS